MADPAHGRFANDARLSDEQKKLFHAWIDNGCAAGYAVVVPSAVAPEREALIQGQVGCERQRIGFTVVARSAGAREVALRLGRSLRPLRVGS